MIPMRRIKILVFPFVTWAIVVACAFLGQPIHQSDLPTNVPSNSERTGDQWLTLLPKYNLAPISTTNGSAVTTIGRLGRGMPLSIAQSPIGNQIAVGTTTGVSFIDLRSWKEVSYIDENTQASSVSYNSDGSELAVALGDGRIFIYDTASKNVIKELPFLTSIPGIDPSFTRYDNLIAFSPDGQYLAATSDYCCLVDLFDSQSGAKLFSYQIESSNGALRFRGLEFDNSGRYLLVVSDKVIVLDAATSKVLQTVSGIDGTVTDAKFTPDAKSIAIATRENGIFFWDLLSQSVTENISMDQLQIRGLDQIDVSPDGHEIVFSDNKGNFDNQGDIGLYNLQANQLAWLVPAHYGRILVKFNKNPEMVISAGGDGYLLFQNLSDGHVLSKSVAAHGFDLDTVGSLALSSDGKTLVAGYLDKAVFWQLPNGNLSLELEYSDQWDGVEALALHPNGNNLVTARSTVFDIWDIRSRKILRTTDLGGEILIRDLAFLQFGRILAVATDEDVMLIDYSIFKNYSIGRIISEFPIQHTASYMATNPSSSLLAFPSRKDSTPTVAIYDVQNGQITHEYPTNEGTEAVAINLTSQLLAIGDSDAIIVLDISSGNFSSNSIIILPVASLASSRWRRSGRKN